MNDEEQRIERTRAVATVLFPEEKWFQTESRIWVAKSRIAEKLKEQDKWKREMAQARILTDRGSVAFFLPDEQGAKTGERCADVVLDGSVMELKTVTGTRVTLGTDFKKAYKQGKALIQKHAEISGHSVFIWLLTDLTVDSVRAKIAGELKERHDSGVFKCFFEILGKLYSWNYNELRAIIGRK
ncbi:MAG: hypothetical protein LBR23_09790 [Spirochaetaceae bacterium]|jgi:hypothetical protein|nr:hypothetical protein [Spirochaetaceae bacterium]